MLKIKHFEVILKISERCNLNCSYCYIFNMGSELAINSAPVISYNTIIELKDFLERVAEEVEHNVIQVDLHGGEPLMLKKNRFIYLCETLRSGDYKGAEFRIGLQTNATLIDNEWIEIFERFNVSVSISIDGPKHINDKYRLDHKGRSSYNATMNGYQALYTAAENRKIIPMPPILSVINPNANGKELFEFFYHDMKCRKFDFLLPDYNYENLVNTEGIKQFLIDVCDAWFEQNDPDCDIRILSAYLRILTRAEDYMVLGVPPQNELHQTVAITVTSTGEIYVDDTLRSTLSDIFTPISHIKHASYKEIINSYPMNELNKIEAYLPEDCNKCIWKTVCAGGRPINRYSQNNAFRNKTIYCDVMQSFLSRGAAYLVKLGISSDEIAKNIGIDANV